MSSSFTQYMSRRRHESQGTNEPAIDSKLWNNFDGLIKAWKDGSNLPLPLSPKIPTIYTDVTIIPKLLSPTLPQRYEDPRNQTDDDDDDLPLSRPKKRKVTPDMKKESNSKTISKQSISIPPAIPVEEIRPKKLSASQPVPKPSTTKSEIRVKPITRTIITTTTDDKELDYNDLVNKREKYLKLATDQKHEGDSKRHKKINESIVHFIDSINLYLFAFHYEDLSRKIVEKISLQRSWISLVQLIDNVIELGINKDIDIIPGLCFQIKSVIYEHLANTVEITLKKSHKEKLSEDLLLQLPQYIKFKHYSKRAIKESSKNLSIIDLINKFPDISKLIPIETLPITQATNIPELLKYSTVLAKLWADDNQLIHEWSY